MSYREVALREMGLTPIWRDRSAPPPVTELVQALPVQPAVSPPAPVVTPARVVPAPRTAMAALATSAPSTLAPPPAATPDPQRLAQIAQMDWAALKAAVSSCAACTLGGTRTQAVFGEGVEAADWMVIGEAPGAEEDATGEPFVGQAGKLLDAMLAAIQLSRQNTVYIANVLKCRPPGNRNPEPLEVAQCSPHLLRQIELVNPKVIVLMGRFAAQALLQTDATIASLRGIVHQVGGRAAIVTYHPAYLLRNLPDKAKAWQDLCLATQTMRRVSAGA